MSSINGVGKKLLLVCQKTEGSPQFSGWEVVDMKSSGCPQYPYWGEKILQRGFSGGKIKVSCSWLKSHTEPVEKIIWDIMEGTPKTPKGMCLEGLPFSSLGELALLNLRSFYLSIIIHSCLFKCSRTRGLRLLTFSAWGGKLCTTPAEPQMPGAPLWEVQADKIS